MNGAIPCVLAACLSLDIAAAGETKNPTEPSWALSTAPTGSRLPREIAARASAAKVITRQELDRSGAISVAEFLRDSTLSAFGSRRPQSRTSAQSVAGISLRGLGESRILVLIDGRRWPVAPSLGSALNLNSIPLAAVERIEILADGASAIYGSDAVGGVVNVITRKKLDGVELQLGVGIPSRAGGETEEGSVIVGTVGERGSVLSGVSYSNRGIVLMRERDYSAGGASTFSNNFNVAVFAPGTLYGFVPGPFLSHPGFGSRVPGADACRGAGFSVTATRCFYDFTAEAADEAETRTEALFSRARYEITEDWAAYLDASVSRVKSFGRLTASASSPWPGGAVFIPVGSPNHPAVRFPDAGYDPVAPVFLRHRFASLGSRDTSTDENLYDLQLGFAGRFGDVSIAFGAQHSESKYLQLGRNYVVPGIAQPYISDGTYDIYDPYANSPAVLDAMSATLNRDAESRLDGLFVSANREVFRLAGGSASLAAGLEYRQERYTDLYDTLRSSGQILGASGTSAHGMRDVHAAYAELLLPILNTLDIALAGRYDHYDDYGSDVSPKLSLRYQPRETLSLHAAFGKGFVAPDLPVASRLPTRGTEVVCNPVIAELSFPSSPCDLLDVHVVPNPGLLSEQTRQFSAGLDWVAADFIATSLHYYDIAIEERIAALSSELILACVLGQTACPPGVGLLPSDPKPPQLGLGAALDPFGYPQLIQRGFANFGSVDTRGLDLRVNVEFDFDRFGLLSSQLQLSRVLNYRIDGGRDLLGDPSYPAFRASLQSHWRRGDFDFSWNVHHIDGTRSRAALGAPPFVDVSGYSLRLPSWTTHDLQARWQAPWNARITLGVRNVGDKDPVIDPLEPTGFPYDFRLYDGYGRVPYLQYRQSF